MTKENLMKLTKVIEKLPPDLEKQVFDFANFLLQKEKVKKVPTKQKKLKLDWAGGLNDIKNTSDVFDMQRLALDWWGKDVSR